MHNIIVSLMSIFIERFNGCIRSTRPDFLEQFFRNIEWCTRLGVANTKLCHLRSKVGVGYFRVLYTLVALVVVADSTETGTDVRLPLEKPLALPEQLLQAGLKLLGQWRSSKPN